MKFFAYSSARARRLRPLATSTVILVLSAFTLQCSDGSGQAGPRLPVDDAGFTVITPSSDSRIIYVSSSTGSDDNDGLSPETPVASVGKGRSMLRDGMPDQLLFRRGDVWTQGLGSIVTSGRSAMEPLVVGAYGDVSDPRPRFEIGNGGRAMILTGAGATPDFLDYVAFLSLEFVSVDRSPSAGGTPPDSAEGFHFLRGTRGLLIEDCVFQYFGVAIALQAELGGGRTIDNVIIRRNLVLDSWRRESDGHSQGMFLKDVANVLIEENIFDHNGWSEVYSGGGPTVFNHNMYIQHSTVSHDIVVQNNIIMRGSSHGIQLRPGGHVEGNLFVKNAINVFLSATEGNALNQEAYATDNVIVHSEDIAPRDGYPSGDVPRGWGIDVSNGLIVGGIFRNLVAHCGGSVCQSIKTSTPVDIADNVVYDWPPPNSNFVPESSGPFPDPDRTIESYNDSLGAGATFAAFADQLRQQRKGNWRPAYTAQVINEYFREGFGL